jgi:nucleoside 2-deoxyribosyltransferase
MTKREEFAEKIRQFAIAYYKWHESGHMYGYPHQAEKEVIILYDELAEDAERYHRLAWLVEFGAWSISQNIIQDSDGLVEENFMENKTMMDKCLNNPEVVKDAANCKFAITKQKPFDISKSEQS